MVDTIKFSQMTNAGNIKNNDVMPTLRSGANVLVNNPWTFLPSGTTAQRPVPSADINYRLRLNTDVQLYEYYDAVLLAWEQLLHTGFTPGPFLTYTAAAGLPQAQNLGLLSNGILKQTVTTGSSVVSIAENGVDYYGPGFTGYFQSPAGVKDAYGNKVVDFISAGPTPAAPNYVQIVNNFAGAPPSLIAAGTDTNIAFDITSKGSAPVRTLTQANGTASIAVISGTGYTHTTNLIFPTSSSTTSATFQDANGTLAYLSDIPFVSASPLTASPDTNVTITLGGTPATALLEATSITLGWTGTLAPSRGGLGTGSVPADGQVPVGSGGNYTPASIGSGTGITVALGAGTISVGLSAISTLNLLANLTGGSAAPTPHTLSAIIDACIGSAQGDILYRSATAWSVLAPGTSGFFLQTQGAAANPQWSAIPLTSAHIFVGNGSNIATDVAMSGDATIANTGAVTVGSIGGKAVVLGGAFTMSGAFTFTGTLTGNTTVTFPTSGTLATTSGSVGTLTGDTGVATASAGNITVTGSTTGLTFTGATSTLTLGGVLGLSNGGTNHALTASAGGIVWSDASKLNILSGTSTANQILLSGNAATPAWSTTTYPATNAINTIMYASSANVLGVITPVNSAVLVSSAGGVPSWAAQLGLASGGTNANLTAANGAIPYSTASAFALLAPGNSGQLLQSGGAGAPSWTTTTFPSTGGAAGNILISNGTNYIASTSLWPNTVGSSGTILRSNGTSNAYTTSTFADTYSVSTILYASSANVVSGLATANSSVLITSAGGVPSLSTTLPSGIAATNMALTTPTIKGSNGFSVSTFADVAVATDYFSFTAGVTDGAIVQLVSGSTNASFKVLAKGSGGVTIGSSAATIIPMTWTNSTNTFSVRIQDWTGNRILNLPDANVNLVSGTMLANALTSAHIFVGSGLNVATDVAMSGDATLANTGAITVASIGGKAVSLGGAFTMSGAFTFTGTVTGNTTVTFPTSGTLATTSQLPGPSNLLPLNSGGTAANLTASNGGIVYSTASAFAILSGTATASQILMSGASAAPSWSTATYPSTAGTSGNIITSDGTNFSSASFTSVIPISNPNMIIGGEFGTNPWQRQVTFSTPGGLTADRWKVVQNTAATYTVTKDTDVPTSAASGALGTASYKFAFTSTTSPGASDYLYLKQSIEGYLYSNIAQTPFTLSFWVKASLTGVYCVHFTNIGMDRHYIAEYTVSSASTWEYKTITVAASPSAGTWNYSNSAGLYVDFIQSCGVNNKGATAGAWSSTFKLATNNQVNAQVNGGTFFIELIKIERGSIATPYIIEPIEKVWLDCFRYYYKSYPVGTYPGAATFNGSVYLPVGRIVVSNPSTIGTVILPSAMPAAPTATVYSPASGASGNVYNYTTTADLAADTGGTQSTSLKIRATATTVAAAVCEAQFTVESEVF